MKIFNSSRIVNLQKMNPIKYQLKINSYIPFNLEDKNVFVKSINSKNTKLFTDNDKRFQNLV